MFRLCLQGRVCFQLTVKKIVHEIIIVVNKLSFMHRLVGNTLNVHHSYVIYFSLGKM